MLAKRSQRRCAVSFGELVALLIQNQTMVRVGGRRQAKQGLQYPLGVRGRKEIIAARDQSHALFGIVHDDGEMIGGWHPLARDNEIARCVRIDEDDAALAIGSPAAFFKKQCTRAPGRPPAIQSQRVRVACSNSGFPVRHGESPARARIEHTIRSLWRDSGSSDFGCDVAARAETGIKQFFRLEPVEHRTIGAEAFRLTHHRRGPCQAKPAEVFINRVFVHVPGAGAIDVLDAQQKPSPWRLRRIGRDKCREGVPQMQISRWTGCEARDNHGALTASGTTVSFATRTLSGPRLPPLKGAATHLVVLCHGYGADGNDLIGLAPYWQRLLPTAAFVAPNAPERCPGSPGYQWFPISRLDPAEMQRGVAKAAGVLDEFLESELNRHRLPADRLALAGFSQGTMMSLHVGLSRPQKPAAIVGFSGMFADGDNARALAADSPPILLVHGDADPMIPVEALYMSATALGRAGAAVQWHVSPGVGHSIDEQGLLLGGGFLSLAFRGLLKRGTETVSCPIA